MNSPRFREAGGGVRTRARLTGPVDRRSMRRHALLLELFARAHAVSPATLRVSDRRQRGPASQCLVLVERPPAKRGVIVAGMDTGSQVRRPRHLRFLPD